MAKLFKSSVLLLAVSLAVSMIAGCGGDEYEEEPVPVNFVSATPPGGEIAANGSITVIFDNAPVDVKVSVGTVTVAGKSATITGPFSPGPLPLTITWNDGIQVLDYTVTAPCCAAPVVIGGTVKDGDTDVNPDGINSGGVIVVEFTKDVSGKITLQTEGGEDVGWLGKVEGNRGTLELVKGRELVNETVYVIVGRISDAEGYEVDIKITFATKSKV